MSIDDYYGTSAQPTGLDSALGALGGLATTAAGVLNARLNSDASKQIGPTRQAEAPRLNWVPWAIGGAVALAAIVLLRR